MIGAVRAILCDKSGTVIIVNCLNKSMLLKESFHSVLGQKKYSDFHRH